MANKKLKKSLKKYDKSKQNKETLISGELGITLDGRRIVEVPGRQGFVYVRLKGNTSELIQAYNATVSPVYDLPVFVVRQTGIYKVVGRNIERHQNQWGTAPFLPRHGGQHSFNHEIGAGGDVVWTYSQQFMPLLSYPSGTQGSMTLSLSPAFYEWEGSFRYAQTTGTPDYTPYLPTITGSARMVLSYLDPSDNSIKLVPGTPFSNSITGAAQIAPYIPDIPRSVGLPLAAVRLTTGTTVINWNAIYDVRDFFTVHVSSGTSGGGGGGGGFGIAGQDEGINIGTGTVLNVVGGGATLTRSGTVLNLSVVGAGGAPSDAKYVTTAPDGTLSAEIVIPGLAGSADRNGVAGAGVAHEFDSGASPLTWSAAVDAEDVNSTVPSHLYIEDNGATETLGTYSWSPTGAFDIRCKISLGAEIGTGAGLPACGLVVGDSAMNNRVMVLLYYNGTNDRYQIDAYTYASSTYTQRGASNSGMGNCVYLRIVRDGSNNNSMYWSVDGITWLLIATQSLTFTAAKAGLRLAAASVVTRVAVDWIRSNV